VRTDAAAQVEEQGYPESWNEVEAPRSKFRWTRRVKVRRASQATSMREQLVAAMGGMCAVCGSEEFLEFHHPKGRTWVARRKNQLQRMRLYERDWKAGRLSLLCSPCNKTIGTTWYWQRSKSRRHRRRR
jgi:hypothetical protein